MKNYSFALAIALALQTSCAVAMFNDDLFDAQIYNNIEMYDQIEQNKIEKLHAIKEKIEFRQKQSQAASKIQQAWKNYKNKKLTKENQRLLKRVKQLEAFESAIKNTSINAENFEYKANLALQALKREQQLMDTFAPSLKESIVKLEE